MDDREILSQDNYFDLENAFFEKLRREKEIEKLSDLKAPTCLLGETVIHSSYGKGLAFEFSKDFKYLEIMFNVVGAKKFIFPEAFEMGLRFEEEKTQKKIEELIKKEKKFLENYNPSHKYDPVEDTKYYKSIEKELDKLIRENIGYGGHIGYCHLYWAEKKRILKTKYGIDWKSPSELNPQIFFD